MNSLTRFIKQHELISFFTLVYVCTWLPHLLDLAHQWGILITPVSPTLNNGLTVVSLIGGPAGAALVLTAVTGGRAGLKQWIAPLFRWRVGLHWYLLTILSYLIIALLAFGIAEVITTGPGPSLSESMKARLSEMSAGLGLSSDNLISTIPILILYGLIVVPLYEELGWRGYALPRMLKQHSALYAGLVIGVIWGGWHLPNFLLTGTPHEGMPFGGFLLSTVSLSVLMVWVYNSTNGSLLMPVLLHGSLIVASMFVSVLPTTNGGDTLPFWISVIEGVICAVVVVLVTGPEHLTRHHVGQTLSRTSA